MTPMLISILAFLAVSALVGLVAFVLRDNSGKAADRLDTLTGRKRKDDATTEILKKSAFERDKKSLLEAITPNLLSLQKIFIQADCHIKPSTLFGIGMVLAILGMTASWLANVPLILAPLFGLVMFTVPFIWLLNKRRVRLKTFASQLPDALE